MTLNFEEQWRADAVPVAAFTLDAVFEIACPDGTARMAEVSAAMRAPMLALGEALGQPVSASGELTSALVAGHGAALAAYYRALIGTLTERGWTSSLKNPFPWFAIRPSVMSGDTHLFAFSYLDSAADAVDLFKILWAAPSAPDELLFHDLDQGWAIHIEKHRGKVIIAEWNWEDDAAVPDIFSFEPDVLASQAVDALARLTSVHEVLVDTFERDYWNFRPPAREPRSKNIWASLRTLLRGPSS